MAAFNRIFLMGTLVRDPELRAGGNGESRTEFRLAVDESRRSRSGELIKKTLFILPTHRAARTFREVLP